MNKSARPDSVAPTLAPVRWLRLLLKSLGPGVITGAADDDPSGIATYSVAGAQLGTKLLWTALLTWPLMAAVQMMCARIGMVTGQGLAGNFKRRFPKWLLGVFVVALLAANTINIAADLAGMADAAAMLSGVNAHLLVVVFALLISWATVRLRYHQIANVLKWLVLVLFAYPITAFVAFPDLVAPYAGTMTAVYGWYPGRYDYKDGFRMSNYSLLRYVGANIALEFLYSGPHSWRSRMHLDNAHGARDPGSNRGSTNP